MTTRNIEEELIRERLQLFEDYVEAIVDYQQNIHSSAAMGDLIYVKDKVVSHLLNRGSIL